MKRTDVAELLASRRQRLFTVLLQLTIVAGPVALVPGVYAAVQVGLWAVVVADIAAYALLFPLYLLRGRFFQTCVSFFLLMLTALGGMLLWTLGLHSAGILWLALPTVLAGVLVAPLQQIMIASGCALVLVVVTIGLTAGAVGWTVSVNAWATVVSSFIVTVAGLSLSSRYLTVGLASALHREQELNLGLRQAADEKALLLAELHHRVRNNLQLVQVLVDFEHRSAVVGLTPDVVRNVSLSFHRLEDRLVALGGVYSRLNTTGDSLRADFPQALRDVVVRLQARYTIQVDGDWSELAVPVPLETASLATAALAELMSTTGVLVSTGPAAGPAAESGTGLSGDNGLSIRVDLRISSSDTDPAYLVMRIELPAECNEAMLRSHLENNALRYWAESIGGGVVVLLEQNVPVVLFRLPMV